MVNWLIQPLAVFIFLTTFALNGCSPVPASPSPQTEAATTEPGRIQQARESNPASSLDAMRGGEAPSSGPLQEVRYDFDRYDLRPDAREILKANANWMKDNPSVRVQIEGHADERGTNEYNLALGAKRAHTSKDYLVSLGISVERLSTVSYGEELPVCKDKTEGCWRNNRRARFVIITARPTS